MTRDLPKFPVEHDPVAPIDLCDPDLFVNGFPHALFTRLRRETPVLWHPEPEAWEKGFWSISRYEDVVRVGMDYRSFSSEGNTQIKDGDPRLIDGPMMKQLAEFSRGSFITMDPPRHGQVRKAMNPFAAMNAIAAHEDAIRRRVVGLIEALPIDRPINIVDTFSRHVPIFTICILLGLGEESFDRLMDWGDRMVGAQDPELSQHSDIVAAPHLHPEYAAVMAEMVPFALEEFGRRRQRPSGDLLSAFATIEVNGEQLSPAALAGIFNLLIVAGNETTRNSFTGGLIALADNPAEMVLLRQDFGLMGNAIDEILRVVSPVMHFRRTATVDTEIGGQKIGAGEKVVIWYPSANRDETIFPDPDRFDIRRANAHKHVAFGRGVHTCIGQHIARLQLRIMLEELLRRRPDITAAEPARYLRTNFVASIKSAMFRIAA